MTKKEKDAEKFAKNMLELEQHLGRDLRPDELMRLAMFASVVNASEEDEKDAEDNAFHINGRRNGKDLFFKKVCEEYARIRVAFEVDKSSKAMPLEQAEVTLTSSLLSEDTLKDLFKPMDECCCDKCDHKEKKMNNNESITGFKELDDALNSIPSDELDKMLKAESEKKKSSSNHEFSDAIAEAALEICGIDLKKKEDQHGHNT